MRVVVDNGADVNFRSIGGNRARHVAALHGKVADVRFLIEAVGADIHVRCDCGGTALMDAAQGGHIETMELLVERGLSVNTLDTTVAKFSSLERAVSNGHVEAVRWLVERGADWRLIDGEDGNSNLHVAVEERHISVVNELLRLDADTRLIDVAGETPYSKTKNLDHVLLLVMHDASMGLFGKYPPIGRKRLKLT